MRAAVLNSQTSAAARGYCVQKRTDRPNTWSVLYWPRESKTSGRVQHYCYSYYYPGTLFAITEHTGVA